MNLPPKICFFIYNLIHLRKLYFVINGELLAPLKSFKGIPQDSIFSPLLFNIYVIIYVMSKCKTCLTGNCEIIQFADIAILSKSSDINKSLHDLRDL